MDNINGNNDENRQPISVLSDNHHNFNFEKLKSEPKNVLCMNEYVGHISSSDDLILYNENDLLYLIDYNGSTQRNIEWKNGCIYDICWSSFLNKFIILCLKGIFTVDPCRWESPQIVKVKDCLDKCACRDQTLLVTSYSCGSIVEECSLTDWKIIKKWTLFDYDTDEQRIKCIRLLNDTRVVLTVNDRFEIRDRASLTTLINYIRIGQIPTSIACLPNNQSIVICNYLKTFTVVSEKGEKVTTIKYDDIVYGIKYLTDKCLLAVRTMDELRLYDLSN
ncbi:unnamed protein product [Didymodactylos carnosus]|uniref:Uncharacterized protein n=1 Tax=Didymodactylos carnosus TaxID=1234261 RepID=A0A816D4K4_9BILA|nr:unnamed protein product [Didymodactylos carnosus]CAF1632416.1 unnamed protein product [Didymodactylos carnosus]CAF4336970.1 unnamed protein product [Didymodactylos carnosus]CAF4532932.1 unnamed protein product [Didymodactylos carnosus]